jgi:acylglycerol lipase
MSHLNIDTLDGLKLHLRTWAPDSSPKAVVCLVHGLGEHSGRYDHVAARLKKSGYATFAIDLRGHGMSEGRRGHASSYTVLMDDLFLLIEKVKEHHPDCPVFLYGHSLGGNLVIHYALRRLPKLAGIIASSPLIRTATRPPRWKMKLLHFANRLLPTFSVSTELDPTALSRNEQTVKTYREDPLVHDRVSARLAIDMMRGGRWSMARAADFPCPLLLMQGSADRITSSKASHEFALRVGDRCTFKSWKDCFHELHNEPEQDQILAYALNWMTPYS